MKEGEVASTMVLQTELVILEVEINYTHIHISKS